MDYLTGLLSNIASGAIYDAVKSWWKERGTEQVVELHLESPEAPPSHKATEADIANLKHLQELLSNDGIIQFLRTHNFGFAYRGAFLEPLDEYMAEEGAAHEFISPGLERLRREFRKSASTFQSLLARNTFRYPPQPDFYRVPDEWEMTQFARWSKAIDDLNASATDVVSRYDALVRAARTELLP